jgi:DNA-binding transcriptional regulator YiaG
MNRDIRVNAEAIRRAVEEYGSMAHLARALGVPLKKLQEWRNDEKPMPLKYYRKILDLLAERGS